MQETMQKNRNMIADVSKGKQRVFQIIKGVYLIMEIPDFLKRETIKEPNPKRIEMMEVVRRYEEETGEEFFNEPFPFSEQEWITMLNECIEQHITIWELWGEEYDPEADY